MTDVRLGFSGRIARAFQQHPLTPILALTALLLGIAAMLITPREEEPQIDVTMANVSVPFPGADVADVENLVAVPLEQVLSGIDGLKHVYSVSRPGMALLTVEYQVGVPRQTALVRLYNQVMQNRNLWPADLGVGQPLVRAMGIDDVPVMALTLWSDSTSPVDLAAVAHTLETDLKHVSGTRDVYTIGAPDRAVIVELDAAKLAAYGLALDDVDRTLKAANFVQQAGDRVAANRDVPVTAGTYLADADEISQLVIGLAHGQPVFVSDVAHVTRGADLPNRYAWFGTPPGKAGPGTGMAPAVTIAITKKSGTNAADITQAVAARVASLQGV
ncbi:MAG: efflux RND transporter permease subunit, partial [Proteobacteria bacterium]|nr:efflux RND transporter permease subunit [Pseudomonadota bacterium]